MDAKPSVVATVDSRQPKPRPLHDGLFIQSPSLVQPSFRSSSTDVTPSLVPLHCRWHSHLGRPPPMDTHRPRPRARKRDSDAVLRASVLDAAIELGIGNKTVAKWMFSPLEEGDEEEEPQQVRSLLLSLPFQSNPFPTASRRRGQ